MAKSIAIPAQSANSTLQTDSYSDDVSERELRTASNEWDEDWEEWPEEWDTAEWYPEDGHWTEDWPGDDRDPTVSYDIGFSEDDAYFGKGKKGRRRSKGRGKGSR